MTPAKLIASLPESIRVGAYDFAIIPITNSEAITGNMYGCFSQSEQNIRLQNDFASNIKAVDVFIHEVNHAVFWVYGIQDDDREERIVSTLGTAWAQIYRDNPWLLKWLAKAQA